MLSGAGIPQNNSHIMSTMNSTFTSRTAKEWKHFIRMQLKRMDHTLRPCLKKKVAAKVDPDAKTQAQTLRHIAGALTVLSGRVPQTRDKKWLVKDFTDQLEEVKSASRYNAQAQHDADAGSTPCSKVKVQGSGRFVMVNLCIEADSIKASVEASFLSFPVPCFACGFSLPLAVTHCSFCPVTSPHT